MRTQAPRTSAPFTMPLYEGEQELASGRVKGVRFRLLVSAEWLIPLVPADQHLVGGGLEGEAQAEQTVEGGGGVRRRLNRNTNSSR